MDPEIFQVVLNIFGAGERFGTRLIADTVVLFHLNSEVLWLQLRKRIVLTWDFNNLLCGLACRFQVGSELREC